MDFKNKTISTVEIVLYRNLIWNMCIKHISINVDIKIHSKNFGFITSDSYKMKLSYLKKMIKKL